MEHSVKKRSERKSAMGKPTFPLNKGCGIVPFLSKGLVEPLSMSVCLFIYLFVLIDLFPPSQSVPHIPSMCCRMSAGTQLPLSEKTVAVSFHIGCHGEGIPHPNDLTSSWQLHHSSLAGLSSRGAMAGRTSPVALWDAVRLATV